MLMLLGAIAVVLGAVYLGQRSLIYYPIRLTRPAFESSVKNTFGEHASVLAPFDAIVLEPPPGIPVAATAILFHGNASLALDRASLAPSFGQRGLRLVLAEYPGYGARDGSPSESALVEDGSALYAAVARQFPRTPIIVAGESLGSGVAVQVAVRAAAGPPSRLVLLTPFLSLEETAARVYPFLPIRLLIRDHFDSAGALRKYTGPVAILVAQQDEVVGPSQGRTLASVAHLRGETVYVELGGAGHNNWSAVIAESQWTELLGLRPIPAP